MGLEAMAAIQARVNSIEQQLANLDPTGRAAGRLGASADTNASFAAALQHAQAQAGGTATPTDPALVTGSTVSRRSPLSNSTNGFLRDALRQSGDRYRFGVEADPSNPDPTVFDCSELVQWAAARNGVQVQDGSWLQYLDAKQKGQLVPVEQALHTPGALLFSFSSEPTPGGARPSRAHVAISLGDGRTIEARGKKYGVGTWEAGSRFQSAAIVPGLT